MTSISVDNTHIPYDERDWKFYEWKRNVERNVLARCGFVWIYTFQSPSRNSIAFSFILLTSDFENGNLRFLLPSLTFRRLLYFYGIIHFPLIYIYSLLNVFSELNKKHSFVSFYFAGFTDHPDADADIEDNSIARQSRKLTFIAPTCKRGIHGGLV